jgi:uncharacterized protein
VRFWDSSALIPLLVSEASSQKVEAEVERDAELVVWWATEVECISALTRLEREGALAPAGLGAAVERLTAIAGSWREVQPIARVRQTAVRLLRVHDLRAADSLQLGAAIAASEDQPASLPFVTLDVRLARAADREGFPVVSPGVA